MPLSKQITCGYLVFIPVSKGANVVKIKPRNARGVSKLKWLFYGTWYRQSRIQR